jgi:hypothetical protein
LIEKTSARRSVSRKLYTSLLWARSDLPGIRSIFRHNPQFFQPVQAFPKFIRIQTGFVTLLVQFMNGFSEFTRNALQLAGKLGKLA